MLPILQSPNKSIKLFVIGGVITRTKCINNDYLFNAVLGLATDPAC